MEITISPDFIDTKKTNSAASIFLVSLFHVEKRHDIHNFTTRKKAFFFETFTLKIENHECDSNEKFYFYNDCYYHSMYNYCHYFFDLDLLMAKFMKEGV